MPFLELSSTTLPDRIDHLTQSLSTPMSSAERIESVSRLKGMIEIIERQESKKQKQQGCSKCHERSANMKVRQQRARVCNNCKLRNGHICTVDGADRRVHIVDGGCPRDEFKGVAL